MAPNEHLLDNFLASKETRNLGADILRLAQVKTGPGSGRELRELKVGLPAAAILVACERLNNTEVTKKSAQSASCLKPKDFKKVYDAVRVILEEKEKASNISYEGLHALYKSGVKFDLLRGFMIEVENEIIPRSGYVADSVLIRCAVFFWVLNCFKPSAVPATEIFAQQNDIPVKKFINVLDSMNDHCKSTRRKIHSLLRGHSTSPIKSSAPLVTLRQSPRKLVSMQDEPASKDSSPKNLVLGNTNADCSQESPLRRSTRNTYSPRIGSISPTKSTLPPPWKKGPKRELPSKDSPKKRIAMDEQRSDIEEHVIRDELPQTPSKRRKLESPSQSSQRNTSTLLVALGEPGSSLDVFDHLASTECQPKSFPSTPRRSSPLKQTRTVASSMDTPSSSDASDSEQPHPRGRFRPVYLDYRQWSARDPRLARIWKRSEKLMALSKINNRVGAKSSARGEKSSDFYVHDGGTRT